MAIEARRGCGYRKVGGLYLVGGLLASPCDRLPFPLEHCPVCGAGVKPARGWTWIRPLDLLGVHSPGCVCGRTIPCPVCDPAQFDQRAGLLWVGGSFYPTPDLFVSEAREQGISRRIARLPRGFVVGGTWVYLAHRAATASDVSEWRRPGIFAAFLPLRVEQLVWRSDLTPERAASLAKAGITPVPVPDGDRDHMGTVYAEPEGVS